VRTGFSVFHGQGLVEKLGRCLLPMVEIFDINSIEYDNDMVEIFDINSIEYDNDKRHIGQCCILFFLKKILTLCLDYMLLVCTCTCLSDLSINT